VAQFLIPSFFLFFAKVQVKIGTAKFNFNYMIAVWYDISQPMADYPAFVTVVIENAEGCEVRYDVVRVDR
jgi:hypothetical protein